MNKAICVLVLAAGVAGGLSSCGTLPSAATASGLDAHFKFHRLAQASLPASASSPSVHVYQALLSRILGSHCQYYPSDSIYHVALAKRCGPVKATVRSVARSFLESDAPVINRSVLVHRDGIYFEDLPNACTWF